MKLALTIQAKSNYIPVVLIRKMEKFRWNPLLLENVESSQSLADRQSIVQLSMDNHLRSGPVVYQTCRIPFLITSSVTPQSTLKLGRISSERCKMIGKFSHHAGESNYD